MKNRLNIYACSGLDDAMNMDDDQEKSIGAPKLSLSTDGNMIQTNFEILNPIDSKFDVLDRENLWISTEVKNDIIDSGWEQNKTLMKYLGSSKDDGCASYFLYLFIPEDQVGEYSSAVERKRKLQEKTYKYVLSMWTDLQYGTEDQLREVIKNGIEDTFEAPIDKVLEVIRTGNANGVGEPITLTVGAIVAIVQAIVSLLIAIISGVIEYCKTKAAAKYTAPSYSELKASVPESTDIIGNSKATSNNWLWLVAGVGAALWFFGKRNN